MSGLSRQVVKDAIDSGAIAHDEVMDCFFGYVDLSPNAFTFKQSLYSKVVQLGSGYRQDLHRLLDRIKVFVGLEYHRLDDRQDFKEQLPGFFRISDQVGVFFVHED